MPQFSNEKDGKGYLKFTIFYQLWKMGYANICLTTHVFQFSIWSLILFPFNPKAYLLYTSWQWLMKKTRMNFFVENGKFLDVWWTLNGCLCKVLVLLLSVCEIIRNVTSLCGVAGDKIFPLKFAIQCRKIFS